LIAEACKELLETEFEVVAIVNNGRHSSIPSAF
jgi:hypothetical protein